MVTIRPTTRCRLPRRRAEGAQVAPHQMLDALALRSCPRARPTAPRARAGPPAVAPTSPDGGTRTRSTQRPTRAEEPRAKSPSSFTVFGPSLSALAKRLSAFLRVGRPWTRPGSPAIVRGGPAHPTAYPRTIAPRHEMDRVAHEGGLDDRHAPRAPASDSPARTPRAVSTARRSPTARTASAARRPGRGRRGSTGSSVPAAAGARGSID